MKEKLSTNLSTAVCIPPSPPFQKLHYPVLRFRLQIDKVPLHYNTTKSSIISNTQLNRRLIITNIHMAKARRSKIKSRSRVFIVPKLNPTDTDFMHIWNLRRCTTIGEGKNKSGRSGIARGVPLSYILFSRLSYGPSFSTFSTSIFLCSSSSKSFLSIMENQKKTYKQALFMANTNLESMKKPDENDETPKAEKAGESSRENPIHSAEKAFEWMDKTITMNVSGLGSFLQKLPKVEENIINLQKTTLFATFWKGAVDNNRLKIKLRTEWQHIKGEFDLIDRANNWYEVNFSNPIDRQTIWDHRPYYAFGNLLVLIPRKTNFDPLTMRLKTIDVWIRILFLPSEYITSEVVAAIIEHNDIGAFIRLDPYTENRTRTKYARVCVAINCREKPNNFVVIPNANGDYKIYRLWFKGVSEGCANCGSEEHQFEFCPLRTSRTKTKEGKMDRNLVQDNASDIHFSEESSVDKGKQKMDWNEVSYKKGIASRNRSNISDAGCKFATTRPHYESAEFIPERRNERH